MNRRGFLGALLALPAAVRLAKYVKPTPAVVEKYIDWTEGRCFFVGEGSDIKTINQALNQCLPGDIIYLLPGHSESYSATPVGPGKRGRS